MIAEGGMKKRWGGMNVELGVRNSEFFDFGFWISVRGIKVQSA